MPMLCCLNTCSMHNIGPWMQIAVSNWTRAYACCVYGLKVFGGNKTWRESVRITAPTRETFNVCRGARGQPCLGDYAVGSLDLSCFAESDVRQPTARSDLNRWSCPGKRLAALGNCQTTSRPRCTKAKLTTVEDLKGVDSWYIGRKSCQKERCADGYAVIEAFLFMKLHKFIYFLVLYIALRCNYSYLSVHTSLCMIKSAFHSLRAWLKLTIRSEERCLIKV